MKHLRRLVGDASGASAIEYALIAALIALVCISGMMAIGTELPRPFQDVADNLD